MEINAADELIQLGYGMLINRDDPKVKKRREILIATLAPMGAKGLSDVPQDQRPLVKAMLMHWIKSDQPKNQETDMQHSIQALSKRLEERRNTLAMAQHELRDMNDAVSAKIEAVRAIEGEIAELSRGIAVLQDANIQI